MGKVTKTFYYFQYFYLFCLRSPYEFRRWWSPTRSLRYQTGLEDDQSDCQSQIDIEEPLRRTWWGGMAPSRHEKRREKNPDVAGSSSQFAEPPPPGYDDVTQQREYGSLEDPKKRIYVKKAELLINGISLSSLNYEGDYRQNTNDYYKLQYILGQANGPFSNGITLPEFNTDSYIMAFSAATSAGGQEGLTIPASRSGTCRIKIQFSGIYTLMTLY